MAPLQHDDVRHTTKTREDHWTKEGLTWTRHHVQDRSLLFQPRISADGPQLDQLEDERVTTMRSSDGTTLSIKDNWRDPAHAERTLKRLWSGTTVFTEKGHYPQVMIDDYTEEAHVPKTLVVPKEPTDEER